MTIQSERFKYMREEVLNLTQQQLADNINVTQQTVAFIENGRKQKIDVEILYKLSQEYLINIEWLLFGTGEITKLETIDKYSSVPNSSHIVPIPFYSAKATIDIDELLPVYSEKEVIYFDQRWLRTVVGIKPENASLIQARGDSMDSGTNQPKDIRDGDLLLIDESCQTIVNGKIFVVQLNNSELVVKKIIKEFNGTVILISNNHLYPVKPLKESEDAKIIGKVVWNGSKENI